MKSVLLLLCSVQLCLLGHPQPAVSAPQEVSHEDIRDAILSLVNIFRDNSDKLERHEHRERQLGEQLKKALAGLDKRYRAQDHSAEIIRMLARVEESVKSMEPTIRQRDERERIQLQKSSDAIQAMQDSLDKIMREIETTSKGSTASYTVQGSDKQYIESLGASLSARIDHLSSVVEALEGKLINRTPISSDVTEDVKNSMAQTKRILEQLEAGGGANPTSNKWQEEIALGIDRQQRTLRDLVHIATKSASDISSLPTKQELQEMNNGTLEILQEVREELIAVSDQAVMKVSAKVEDSAISINKGHEDILSTVNDVQAMAENFYSDVSKSYEQLLKEIKGLSKVEQVMIQTADNVLDTKRRIEYGVHQILLEVGDLIKVQGKALNATVNQRFDDIESTILDNQTGALSNLTTKIETEISQVWRQIGIMYQQLTASVDALDRLQQQTDSYVNGSVTTMDSMQDKVGKITSRMSEVDDNLNFLLGRLSLVTSEFNQIKSGLASALDNIRNSFLEVQNEIKDVGPGPRPIKESEINNQVPSAAAERVKPNGN